MNRVYDPIVYGDYPKEMREVLGSQLPNFSELEKNVIRGSLDYICVNHYTTLYTKDCLYSACSDGGDRPIKGFLNTTGYRDGISIGDPVCCSFSLSFFVCHYINIKFYTLKSITLSNNQVRRKTF